MSRTFAALAIVSLQLAQATDCRTGTLHDIFASAQEMILLMAAFTVGWHLIGPCLGLLLRKGARNASEMPMVQESQEISAKGEPSKGLAKRDQRALELAENFTEPSQALPEGLYAEAFEACVRDGDFESASRLARGEWVPQGPKAHGQVLALVRWLARKHDLASAEKCLRNLRKVDLRTRKSLILACAQSGNMDAGAQYFSQLKADMLQPDFATYSSMIRGYCNVGKVEDALGVLELMLGDRIQPDAMLLDALLEGAVSRNFFQGADRILALMKELAIQPSNTTLAACIKLYASRGEVHRAQRVFEDMVQKYHLQPNSYVYGNLIAAAFCNGRPELALSTYERMVAAGCTPCARTYEHLVQCCLQLGFLDMAAALLDEALGLKNANRPRAYIDPKVIEELLLLITRRKETERLGLPLLKRLAAADFEIPERFERFAQVTTEPYDSVRSQRRKEFDRWRDFSVGE
ncbi:unnamed protein product [Effrenium voratum]|nr:unnamed protein product [Effrenium voratum]|mmetsp:Transcript_111009/g.264893  ORF Transcript_111009/g.264893 Transcript_111009/m.264893 type:complete len:464 (-) Transcript_111009:175-1566(-)|eukprot:CAMPEP_0181438642 /NCGR_PEP_ID=MMETSP1110-20121109/22014_1 /TAXON_ID=174948 /ORGANISM="Symbiodinium sp., Strain CCMP421" /LENGTH=463 /DNA_ID=CAMNT_0023562335 /DNA_START=137 /DNA_END=1528 /DNA_ORIENTATION=+